MQRSTFALALVAAMASANPNQDPDFWNWVAQNNKNFADADDMHKREANFNKEKANIQKLRRQHPKMQFALNYLADWTDEEKANLLGADLSDFDEERRLQAVVEPAAGRKLQSAVPGVNWIERNHVGPVKNQGQCGSCWSFNATTVLEAVKSIKDTAANGGSLVDPVRLSEQEGVDCSWDYGNAGCGGGWPSSLWAYARDNGMATAAEYPYTASDGDCARNNLATETSVASYAWVPQDDQAIAQALQQGPLSMAVWVDSAGVWYNYRSGDLDASTCDGETSVNHAVALVGYENGEGYWQPGEDVWIEGTEDVWVPATEEECIPATDPIWVPGTEDYCRSSKRRERRRNRCNNSEAILSEDKTECCIPGDEGYWEDGQPEQCTPGEPGYWIYGDAGYWQEGEDVWVESAPAAWIIQNSWGSGWGNNGTMRIPVQAGTGVGVCQSQKYIQSVLAN